MTVLQPFLAGKMAHFSLIEPNVTPAIQTSQGQTRWTSRLWWGGIYPNCKSSGHNSMPFENNHDLQMNRRQGWRSTIGDKLEKKQNMNTMWNFFSQKTKWYMLETTFQGLSNAYLASSNRFLVDDFWSVGKFWTNNIFRQEYGANNIATIRPTISPQQYDIHIVDNMKYPGIRQPREGGGRWPSQFDKIFSTRWRQELARYDLEVDPEGRSRGRPTASLPSRWHSISSGKVERWSSRSCTNSSRPWRDRKSVV